MRLTEKTESGILKTDNSDCIPTGRTASRVAVEGCYEGRDVMSEVPKGDEVFREDRQLKRDFGAQLRRLRRRLGMSLEELEGKTGISSSSLSLYERGKGNPTLQSIQLLAQSLNVPIYELLGEYPNFETQLCHAQLLLECIELISAQSTRKGSSDELFVRALRSTILLNGIQED